MEVLLEHLQFLDSSQDPTLALVGDYNSLLVALSIIVACIAAYSALRIVERISAASSFTAQSMWVMAGALTMGIGVWAMHFVGMLAFILPIPVNYNLSITLVSMLPSILASIVMLYVIGSEHIGIGRLIVGGTLMGAGIGIMHYTGMAAMQTNAVMLYDLPLFIASIVVAVVLASVALYTNGFVSSKLQLGRHWTQVGAAVIMGFAVSGMHYTGMAAANFFPNTEMNAHTSHMSHMVGAGIDPIWLGAWVTSVSILIIGITVFITMLDQRLEIARKYGAQLEILVDGRTQELRAANQRLQIELDQRSKTQEALRIAKEAAEAASQAKADFLANMSHEIRTPLNAIVGMTELLMDTPLVNEQRDFTDTIRTSSDTLLSVINDILDFSKIDADKMELENQSFDLQKCIEEALDIMAIKAAEKKLELAYVAEGAVPGTIVGDVSRLRQVLINLLNNAIKFTDQGEVVMTVKSCRLAAHPPIAIVASEPAQPDLSQPDLAQPDLAQPDLAQPDLAQPDLAQPWCELHFSVRDTGIGIPEERRDRLFLPFSQIDTSTTRKYGGTGLGLIISQRLCELMHGRMWVVSAGEGQGSTFHFTIQAQVVGDQLSIQADDFASLLNSKRGLVVDDNAANRQIVTRQLEAWGIQASATASGADALSWLQYGESYDFAILDLCMPEMDGFTVARRIRQHPHGAKLPLIMLSSVNGKAVHAEALELGFAAVLTKPIKPAQLGKVLRAIFLHEAPVIKPTEPLSNFDPSLVERLPLRILLAEDNLVNQKVAQRTLARLGYQVTIVDNGAEAVQEVQRHSYDVILMDVQMPEMDGLEATQVITSQVAPEQRPYIIAVTAHAMSGDEEKCLAAGMDAYITKPIQLEKLVAALMQCKPGAPVTSPAIVASSVESDFAVRATL